MPAAVRRAAWLPVLLAAACTAKQLPAVDDRSPPAIRVVEPAAGVRVETPTPAIRLDYSDDRAGVHVVTFRARINGVDYSTTFDHDSRGATGRIPASKRLPLGENLLEVELADRAGNVGTTESRFINAAGGWLAVTARPGAEPARHIELILDASGSMLEPLGVATRMDVAKQAIGALVEELPTGTPLGLRVFRGCDGIASLVPIRAVDKPAYVARVDSIRPNGGTPIVASLLQSFDALSAIPEGQRVAVLVTDGGESCEGDLANAINRAKDAATRVIIIGFDIEDAGITAALRNLAESTGGAFFDAREPAQLRSALERSVARLGYFVIDAEGQRIADGDIGGAPVELPVGTYEVRIATIPAIIVSGVEIGSLTDTGVELRRTARGIEGVPSGPVPSTRVSRAGGRERP